MKGFIDGECPMPTANENELNPNLIAWRKSDPLLRGWITGTLSEEVLGRVVGLQTSAKVWSTLMKLFAHVSMERQFLLMQWLQLYQKKNLWIVEHVTGLDSV
jgi:hypothetical protein